MSWKEQGRDELTLLGYYVCMVLSCEYSTYNCIRTYRRMYVRT